MTLIKWTPNPISIMSDVDKIINSTIKNDWNFSTTDHINWTRKVDIEESEALFYITAEIPGIPKKDINVSLSDKVLTISGERKINNEKNYDNFHYKEIEHGKFKRSFNLPESINEEKIKAKFRDGLLSIELSKHKVTIPKDKEIKIN